jgi:hypothetical protein
MPALAPVRIALLLLRYIKDQLQVVEMAESGFQFVRDQPDKPTFMRSAHQPCFFSRQDLNFRFYFAGACIPGSWRRSDLIYNQ